MKKFLMIGALALGLAAVSGQEASAWIKCNFSVGLNWSWESGNNSFLWGLWSSGQVPGYPSDLGTLGVGYPGPSPYAGMMGGPAHYGDHGAYAPAAPHGPRPSSCGPRRDRSRTRLQCWAAIPASRECAEGS